MKGIVLAGGTGSRLLPITRTICKQLLPIYDKPLVYYPISTLMDAGVKEILIITTPHDLSLFQLLLGNGSNFGVNFTYAVQEKPDGLAQALIIGKEFLNGDSCLMILGDNIFHGDGLGTDLRKSLPEVGAHIFTYKVSNPNQYGILTLDGNGDPCTIVEKPEKFDSKLAVTGLYYFDGTASDVALTVTPSKRGELEITSVIDHYLQNKMLSVTHLSRGTAWLDTGNPNALQDASTFIRVMEERTGLKIACLEEIAFKNGWITKKQLEIISDTHGSSSYAQYLRNLII